MTTTRAARQIPRLYQFGSSVLFNRIVMGLALGVLTAAALMLDEGYLWPWSPLWLALILVALTLAAVELCNLFAATSARPSLNTVLGGLYAIVIANWVPHINRRVFGTPDQELSIHAEIAHSLDALSWPFLAFAGVLMVAFVSQGIQFTKPGRTMATLAGTILAIAYLGVLGTFTMQLRWIGGAGSGITALGMLIATAKGSDTGAYTFGRLFGRHKLWPRLSPNKTIEGAIGGIVGGIGGAFLVSEISARMGGTTLTRLETLGFAIVVSATAQLGDLIESMIKRDSEQKDASETLPGFGGVLDVIDSMLFAGPVAFAYWIIAAR